MIETAVQAFFILVGIGATAFVIVFSTGAAFHLVERVFCEQRRPRP